MIIINEVIIQRQNKWINKLRSEETKVPEHCLKWKVAGSATYKQSRAEFV